LPARAVFRLLSASCDFEANDELGRSDRSFYRAAFAEAATQARPSGDSSQLEGDGTGVAHGECADIDRLSWSQVAYRSVNRAIDSKQRDEVVPEFGTFRNEFRKGSDRFRTVMDLVLHRCLVNHDRRNRP
jgi:hypothetical protein